jgi:hypothetical protein
MLKRLHSASALHLMPTLDQFYQEQSGQAAQRVEQEQMVAVYLSSECLYSYRDDLRTLQTHYEGLSCIPSVPYVREKTRRFVAESVPSSWPWPVAPGA